MTKLQTFILFRKIRQLFLEIISRDLKNI